MDNKKIGLIKKSAPFIAIACAALSLIFAFLIGTTVKTGGATDSKYFYQYFGSVYENLKLFEDADQLHSSLKSVYILKTVVYAIELALVLAMAGITCYCAIRRYFLKKEEGRLSLEKFAVFTYLAYILFAISYSAGEVIFVSESGESSRTTGIATIIGIVFTSLAACAYFTATILPNISALKNKRTLVNFIYTAIVVVVICVVLGIASSALIGFNAVDTIEVDGVKIDINMSLKGGFPSVLENVLALAQSKSFNLIPIFTSAVVFGYILVIAISALSLLLLGSNLNKPFGKEKSDSIFYGLVFGGGVLELFFAAISSSYVGEIIGLKGSMAMGYSLALISLTAFLFILAFLRGKIVSAIVSKLESKAKNSDTAAVENRKEGAPLLEVNNLCMHFPIGSDFFGRPNAWLKAVDNVSFKLEKGKTLGIVGESGCGKTTMGRTILRLYDITSGDVWFDGEKVSALSNSEFEKYRPKMQMIFQDPYASLSPRLTVGEIIGEAARQHGLVDKKGFYDYVVNVMKMCGLQPHYFERYPHEFSGGQRQRICIARALALKPELVICDEPVSALDVSIQAQIINMLIELKKTLGLTYVFISHDLSVVKHISDEVGVMYLGSLVEYGTKADIFNNTLHPYTKALFSAVPVPNVHVKMDRIILKGDIPSPVNPPSGCKFHTRCEDCMEVCEKVVPEYVEVTDGHFCACHKYNQEYLKDPKGYIEAHTAAEENAKSGEAVENEEKEDTQSGV